MAFSFSEYEQDKTNGIVTLVKSGLIYELHYTKDSQTFIQTIEDTSILDNQYDSNGNLIDLTVLKNDITALN